MKNIPPLYQWILSWLRPLSFLSGSIFGFLLLTVVGKIISTHNIYEESLQRFTLPLSAETLFYPTASQLLSLAQSRLSKDGKIAVIIGGDSVFHGVGQSAQNLWSRELQTQLGNDYQVLNLAMRGSWPQETGGVTAQSLLKLGYKRLIYVTDTGIGRPGRPDDGSFYKYLFWDAYYQGLLLEDRDRDTYLSTAPFSEEDLESRRLMGLNSKFRFNEVWSFLGYHYVFTVWNGVIASYDPLNPFYWLYPRRSFSDDTEEMLTLADRYPPEYFSQQLGIVKSYCKLFKLTANKLEPDRQYWDVGIQEAKNLYPDELKKRTLIVVLYDSPYYRQRLPLDEQQCPHQGVKETQRLYQETGYFTEIISEDFNELDYRDRNHLSPSGGYKLAVQVASSVRQISQKLGYLGNPISNDEN